MEQYKFKEEVDLEWVRKKWGLKGDDKKYYSGNKDLVVNTNDRSIILTKYATKNLHSTVYCWGILGLLEEIK